MPLHAPRLHRSVIAAGTAAVVVLTGTTATAVAAPGAPTPGGLLKYNLVADTAGAARATDPHLVNAWGLSASPTGPLWVSNAGTATSTLYTGATAASPSASVVPLVVAIPGGGVPTGQVYNPTSGFVLGNGSPALFIFASVTGAITAWNPGDGTTAEVVSTAAGASYTGLALANTSPTPTLLAADFPDARINVYDSAFHPLYRHGAFPATGVPAGYAPFDVAALGNQVYVSYALQSANRQDDVPGPGHGYVNVFTRTGRYLRTLVAQGALNSPWGLAIAPPGFGTVAGDLLVGNFGDGRIHAYNAQGTLVQTLHNNAGAPIVIPGLWGLLPGNGTNARTSDVWFSAGTGRETHGLLGILRPAG